MEYFRCNSPRRRIITRHASPSEAGSEGESASGRRIVGAMTQLKPNLTAFIQPAQPLLRVAHLSEHDRARFATTSSHVVPAGTQCSPVTIAGRPEKLLVSSNNFGPHPLPRAPAPPAPVTPHTPGLPWRHAAVGKLPPRTSGPSSTRFHSPGSGGAFGCDTSQPLRVVLCLRTDAARTLAGP